MPGSPSPLWAREPPESKWPERWPRSARETLKHDFRSIRPADARIVMLDSGPRVLAGFPEDLSAHAEAALDTPGRGGAHQSAGGGTPCGRADHRSDLGA